MKHNKRHRNNRTSPKSLAFLVIVIALAGLAFVAVKKHASPYVKVALAAVNCSSVPTDTGVATVSNQNVSTTGTYKIWSRIQSPDNNPNSYYLRFDDSTCFKVGGASITPNSWTWVNYEDGTTGTPITIDLNAGNHKIEFVGNQANVKLDRVILTTDSCVPTGNGDNCVTIDQAPQVSVVQPNPSTVSGTVGIAVLATDTDSTPVSKVELFANGSSIGVVPVTQFGYVLQWDTRTVANGTYQLTAKATDTANLTTTSGPVTVTINNGGGPNPQSTASVYRLFNPTNGEHFYTLDGAEKDHATTIGLIFEGIAFNANTTQVAGSSPVNRLINNVNHQHFFTADDSEKSIALTKNFSVEGVAFYAFRTQAAGTTPLYRLLGQGNGEHFYTKDVNERDIDISRFGYLLEGVALYVPTQ